MNIEELRKLKNKLEKEKNEGYYISLDGITKGNIENSLDYVIAFEDIFETENTNDFIKNIENLIENTVRYLSLNNIPYNQIRLSSYLEVFCKKEFGKKLKENLNNDTKFKELMKDLPNQISTTYVGLRFGIELAGTGTENTRVDDYIYKNIDFNNIIWKDFDLEDNNVEGIVNFDEFISKMADLGYIVEFDNKECNSINDYINEFINKKDGDMLYITVDFGRQKAIQKSKGTKR